MRCHAMSTMPPVPESEVRDIVRRVLDGVLASSAAEGSSASTSAPEASDPQAGGSPPTDARERVAIGADHGGFQLKEDLSTKLSAVGYEVVDCGTDGPQPVDYPEFAHAVARHVSEGACDWGIVVDGAGIGSAMAANKVPGVRAALCYDLSTARNSREHNHANVLTLGAALIGPGLAWQIVRVWLAVPWGPERHARRVALITDIEQQYLGAPR
jgi:ribose 5-phosphate isomerase B